MHLYLIAMTHRAVIETEQIDQLIQKITHTDIWEIIYTAQSLKKRQGERGGYYLFIFEGGQGLAAFRGFRHQAETNSGP